MQKDDILIINPTKALIAFLLEETGVSEHNTTLIWITKTIWDVVSASEDWEYDLSPSPKDLSM